jgi:hypothetical protein
VWTAFWMNRGPVHHAGLGMKRLSVNVGEKRRHFSRFWPEPVRATRESEHPLAGTR